MAGLRPALLAAGLLASAPAPALAEGDGAAGRRLALRCQACHGLDGLAKIPEAANLAGQPEAYLTAALNAYRSGERRNETMSTVAASLSDADVADLAAYYAGIEITAKVPGR